MAGVEALQRSGLEGRLEERFGAGDLRRIRRGEGEVRFQPPHPLGQVPGSASGLADVRRHCTALGTAGKAMSPASVAGSLPVTGPVGWGWGRSRMASPMTAMAPPRIAAGGDRGRQNR